MLFWIIGLLSIGVVLIVLEALLPGFDFGISGILGLIAVIASSVLIIMEVDNGVFIVAGKVVVIGLFIAILTLYFRKRGAKRSLILNESLANDPKVEVVTEKLKTLVGKSGVTKTALRPHGLADLDCPELGIDIEVRSLEGYMVAGENVVVDRVVGGVVYVKAV